MDNNILVRPLWILFFVVSLIWVDGSIGGNHGVVGRQMHVENQSISIVNGASKDVGGEVSESKLNVGGDHEQGKNTTESSVMSSKVGRAISEMDQKHERKGRQGHGGGGGGGGGGGRGGGGGYGWGWGVGGGSGGNGGYEGEGGGGGVIWGWGRGGGFRGRGWGCHRGPANSNGRRRTRAHHHHKHKRRVGHSNKGVYKLGEYAHCLNKGRCNGMQLDCPLHCDGPCYYDCDYMCKATCKRVHHL